MAKQFTTPKRDRKQLDFELDGEAYTFVPQKMAGVMLPVIDPGTDGGDDSGGPLRMTQAMWDWLRGVDPTSGEKVNGHGLPEEQYARLRARLEDPDDDLDIGDVAEVVRWLVGQAAGRPTTPRRG